MEQGMKAQNSDNLMVMSYWELRKSVGRIGIGLPLVMVAGKYLFEGPGIQTSISAYYYTVMRDVLVGSLWAIAIFLLAYRGYEKKDDRAGDLASLFAVGVALFPTTPEAGADSIDRIIGAVHFGFAAAMFLVLAYFCLVLFRKGDPIPTPQKLQRNMIYTVCGYLILACIVAIALVLLLPWGSKVAHAVFWLEAIAIWAFGLSWFTKGEGFLRDVPN